MQIRRSQIGLSHAIGQLENSAITKDDLKTNSPNNNQFTDINRELSGIKSFVQEKISQNELDINQLVLKIAESVLNIKIIVDDTRRQTKQLESEIHINGQYLTKKIEETSWGFWIYFALFQILFGMSFLWWKKLREKEDNWWK